MIQNVMPKAQNNKSTVKKKNSKHIKGRRGRKIRYTMSFSKICTSMKIEFNAVFRKKYINEKKRNIFPVKHFETFHIHMDTETLAPHS